MATMKGAGLTDLELEMLGLRPPKKSSKNKLPFFLGKTWARTGSYFSTSTETSERNLIDRIRDHASRLAQAVADAGFWHDRWLEAAQQEHQQKLSAAEAAYQQAVSEAQTASERRLQQATQAAQAQRSASETAYQQAMAQALARYTPALETVSTDAGALAAKAGLLAAPWGDLRWRAWSASSCEGEGRGGGLVRIGRLIERGQWHHLTISALLPLIGGRNVVIRAGGPGKELARAAMQSAVLRLLATVPPGKLRLTCIDPVGLGSTVAGFIKGLPDSLTGGQAWFDAGHIEQRLADLEGHTAFVKQKYLGVSFPTMEAYNAQAGQIEEPYRLLVVADFPARFTDSAAARLVSIATNGPGTGVYVLAMVDTDQPKLPYGFILADLERTATVLSWQNDGFVWEDTEGEREFRGCRLELDAAPPAGEFERIVAAVGKAAIAASDVKLPFASLGRTQPDWAAPDARTGAGLRVPIGQFGAKEIQTFSLDEKLLNSALVIGRPGSGKSILLHVLVNQLALAYPPDEIELYLLDLKEVEFKDYATYRLPHARVVAINCEREFGLSVLRELDAELRRRMDRFRGQGVAALSDYRAKTGQKLPRALLVVDEFQELFSADDALASEAGLILDRLVRQGRAFGVNVLLASQTLAGPYTFSNATKNQIPIRIVLQCSDADSQLALSDENDRARLLGHPGEAIHNTSNGRIEGNNRFQVAWLPDDEREGYLRLVRERADESGYRLPKQIVFEGNAPAHLENNPAFLDLLSVPPLLAGEEGERANGVRLSHGVRSAWLGEPVEIKPHTAAAFRRQSRANLLIVGQNEYEGTAAAMLNAAVLSIAAQQSPRQARFVLLNLADVDAAWHDLPLALHDALPHDVTVISRRRDVLQAVEKLAAEVNARLAQSEDARPPSLYLVIIGLHRARDLRRDENSGYPAYSYGNDAAEPRKLAPAEQLALICREGPDVGMHTLLWCDTCANFERVLDRNGLAEFDMRVALQMGAEDSRRLLDSEAATKLGPYRALFFDEERTGRLEKFRPYGLLSAEQIAEWGKKLKARG